MASDRSDRPLGGWSLFAALGLAALATAVVSTIFEGSVKWVAVGVVVLAWVVSVTAVWWRLA